jgi:putative transposase
MSKHKKGDQTMKKIKQRVKRSKREMLRLVSAESVLSQQEQPNSRLLMIQQLIPLGLAAVQEELQAEVSRLVGGLSHERTGGSVKRWGSNPGSVVLGGQKLSVEVPRVRDLGSRQEVTLESYRGLKNREGFDERVFLQLINGLSAGKYEQAAELVPATFGISKGSVSRSFKRSSEKKLRELLERDLSDLDIIAVFIDGKHLGDTNIVIALGITMQGEKIPLGFVETGTENSTVCKDFMQKLQGRGLNTDNEILFIIDGAKGLASGIKTVLGNKALIQRCQWHKRENIVAYLPKKHQTDFRRKLQAAYEMPGYKAAKQRLLSIRRELMLINESAANSLDEGLEETLTLHRLGVFKQLGRSFKTTNCIENINRQVDSYLRRVCRWHNSNQRRRWIASALLELSPKLNKVSGYQSLPLLRDKMKNVNAVIKKVA